MPHPLSQYAPLSSRSRAPLPEPVPQSRQPQMRSPSNSWRSKRSNTEGSIPISTLANLRCWRSWSPSQWPSSHLIPVPCSRLDISHTFQPGYLVHTSCAALDSCASYRPGEVAALDAAHTSSVSATSCALALPWCIFPSRPGSQLTLGCASLVPSWKKSKLTYLRELQPAYRFRLRACTPYRGVQLYRPGEQHICMRLAYRR